jgi:tetratricopeptide (TPR) repeat protein
MISQSELISMKKTTILIILSFPLFLLAGSPNVDSMKILLSKETNFQKRIDLKNLIGEYSNIERISFWDSIIKEANQIKYEEGLIYASFMQSLNYTKKGSYEKAIQLAGTTLSLARKTNNEVWLAYTFEHLASLNVNINEYNSALQYFNEALKLSRKKENYRTGHILVRIGEIYEKQNKNKQVLEKYNQSLIFF